MKKITLIATLLVSITSISAMAQASDSVAPQKSIAPAIHHPEHHKKHHHHKRHHHHGVHHHVGNAKLYSHH